MTEIAVRFQHVSKHLMLRRKSGATVPANRQFQLTGYLRRYMTNHVLHHICVRVHYRRAQETLSQKYTFLISAQ